MNAKTKKILLKSRVEYVVYHSDDPYCPYETFHDKKSAREWFKSLKNSCPEGDWILVKETVNPEIIDE